MEFISRESVSCGKRGMWFRRNCFVSVNAVMINLYPNDCAGQKHYIVFRSYLIISFFHVNCSVLHDFNSNICHSGIPCWKQLGVIFPLWNWWTSSTACAVIVQALKLIVVAKGMLIWTNVTTVCSLMISNFYSWLSVEEACISSNWTMNLQSFVLFFWNEIISYLLQVAFIFVQGFDM